jgi:hypothetical protein
MFILPSGKRLHNHGKSPLLGGKSTISMAIFNGYELPEGNTLPFDCFILRGSRPLVQDSGEACCV